MEPQAYTLLARTGTADDGIGGKTATWAPYGTIDGYLDLLSGSDQNTILNAAVEQSTHILVAPNYQEGVTAAMRVQDGSRWYEITHVDDPMGQHHHLELYLKYGGEASGD